MTSVDAHGVDAVHQGGRERFFHAVQNADFCHVLSTVQAKNLAAIRCHQGQSWPKPSHTSRRAECLLIAEFVRQFHVLVEQRVVVADHQDIIISAKALQEPAVVEARQIIERRVQVRVLVVDSRRESASGRRTRRTC